MATSKAEVIALNRPPIALLLIVALALLGCGRSQLRSSERDVGAGATGGAGGGGAAGAAGGAGGKLDDPPPPPPPCSAVSFSACEPWADPTVVSLPGETGLDSDVAWQGRMHLVAYESTGDDEAVLVAVDRSGEVLWREGLGISSEPRLAWSPLHSRGLVAGREGLRWLRTDGHASGAFAATSPWGGAQMNADVAPVAEGFAVIVSPTSDPGGNLGGTYALLGPTPGAISWETFHDKSPNPSIEHATGSDGMVHRFGFETSGVPMQILQFEWDGNKPVGPVAPPWDLGSSTTFTDAMVTAGGATFFGKSTAFSFLLLEVRDDGYQTAHSFVAAGQLRGIHLERLGTEAGLGEIVVAAGGLVDGHMALAVFDPVSSTISDPLVVGPGHRNPRLSRTGRGLALSWSDSDNTVMLTELDCCADP